MLLYHNVEQNKKVEYADEVADEIVRDGFAGKTAFLSSWPLGENDHFAGVEVLIAHDISRYRVESDALEGVAEIYEIPADWLNQWPRRRYYTQPGEVRDAKW